MKHIKGLDTLRAFAFIMVLIEHWGPVISEEGPIAKFIHSFCVPDGSFGVDLFFVLSGFLITSILLKARTEERGTARFHAVKNFFFRRALRIFPVYYFVVLVAYSFNIGDVQANIGYILTYTLNIVAYHKNAWPSMGYLWSLAVEEQYYLLWPWLIIFVKEKYLKYVFIAAILIGVVSSYICMAKLGHINPFLVINCFDAFGIGGAYAYTMRNEASRKKFEKAINYIAVAALGVYLYWKTRTYLGYIVAVDGVSMGKTIDSIISLWLVMLVINCKPGKIKRYFLENRVLNYIGKISYGLYLYHLPMINILSPTLTKWIATLIKQNPTSDLLRSYGFSYFVSAVSLVIIATLSFYLIEKHFLRLKRFFEYKSPKRHFPGSNVSARE